MVSIDYSLILVIFNFGLLVYILNKFIFKKVKKYLEERQTKIALFQKKLANSCEKAEKLVLEKKKALIESEKESMQEHKRIVDKAEKQAQKVIHDVKDREKQIIGDTQRELISSKDKIVKGLSDQMIQLIIEISSKVVSQKMDIKEDEKFITSLIAKGI